MKKINFLLFAVALMTALLQSCSSDEKQTLEKEKDFLGIKAILDRPVDYEMAQGCLSQYGRLMTNPLTKKTKYVTFDKKAMIDWLKNTDSLSTYDNIQVSFGRYTAEILKKYEKDEAYKNRLTVFLFPYNGKTASTKDKVGKGNEKVEPFNMGEVHP